jgi:HD-like signal output (HDOD) protein
VIRILFVDDEPLLLDGLRASLRSERRRWEMLFAEGARAALSVIEEKPVDILVTDMRMPGMDGAALLATVRESHPATARIVLSGQADEPASRRLVNLAHQCLAKPARPEEIRTVLERTCWLRSLIADERLREVVGGIDQLPVLPAIFAGVSRLAEDPHSSARDIARLIASDPGLCAKVMQITNSAFFGQPRRLADVAEAVAFLGVATVRCLVLSVEVMDAFDQTPVVARPILTDVRARALATGRLARRMALTHPGISPDEAFLAGVLHDVGMLVLATASARTSGVETSVTHGEVGGYLLGLWGLSPTVVGAVAHHHHPAGFITEELDLALLVHVAQALVWERAHPDRDSDPSPAWIDEGLLEGRVPDGWVESWRRTLDEDEAA